MKRVRLSLKPGQPGTKGLLARYGKSLVCVRYRYDERTKQRLKTVELIVDTANWRPAARHATGESPVAVRVDWQETELRRKVKAAGGKWDPERRVWRLGRERVEDLGLERRIVEGAI
ncbi:MAG: hypothetical protein GY722_27830 [bacterium]|nr:hypothetical protein [bacterium]